MPPISWTSKWRMPRVRLDALATTAEGLGQEVVERLATCCVSLLLLDPLHGHLSVSSPRPAGERLAVG